MSRPTAGVATPSLGRKTGESQAGRGERSWRWPEWSRYWGCL